MIKDTKMAYDLFLIKFNDQIHFKDASREYALRILKKPHEQSQLSPFIKFGQISIREVFNAFANNQ